MVKVCHMTSAHGIEDVRIFHKECVSLAKSGYEVYLVERGNSYDKNNVHIIGVGEIPQERQKRMTEGTRRVFEQAVALDCEVYHLHDPELLQYAKALKRLGKKVIFDSHEHLRSQIMIRDYLPLQIRKILASVYGKYEDHVLSFIDGVIFPCPINGSFPYKCKHWAYVNNVPILGEFYDNYDPNVRKEERTICVAGGLTYERGIKQLILATHKAKCHALIAGVFSPSSFEQDIISMPEARSSSFLGKLNRQEVLALYQKSTIGSAALLNVGQYSSAENLPTKVYEYMSMAIPVILSRTPFNEEMVKKYNFGICVDPEDIAEYAAAIEYLIDYPQLAKKMGENGRRAVKDIFNWEVEVQNLLRLYEEILK